MTELLGIAILFLSVAAMTLLVSRLPVPNEAAYILTGVLLVQATFIPDVVLLAEAGAVLVIFLTTMHLRIDAMRHVLIPATAVTMVHALALLAITAAAMRLGIDFHGAVLIGAMATFGSSMIGIDLLENQVDRRLMHARLTEAINFGQDMIIVLLIGMLPFWPQTAASLNAGIGTGAVLIAMLLFRRPVKDLLSRMERYEETTLLFGLLVLWGMTSLLSSFTYGTIIAAVAAGLLVSTHPENLTLLETLGPVRDFFATLFFISLGILVATPLQADMVLAGALVVFIMVIRPLITMLVLAATGITLHTAIVTAAQLDQPSELVLLLGLVFHVTGLTNPAVSQAIVLAAAATFIISAYTTYHADRIYHGLLYPITTNGPGIDREDHLIIAGYGGRGSYLATRYPDAVIIDNDPAAIRAANENGHATVLGDINDRATWHRAGLPHARLAVLTIPSDTVARRLHAADTDAIVLTETPETATALRERGIIFAADLTSMTTDELIAQLEALLVSEGLN